MKPPLLVGRDRVLARASREERSIEPENELRKEPRREVLPPLG